VRAGGSMDILDLITMSIEWYLGLTYDNSGGQGHASGEASVTVSISIGFFSVSATMSMHWGWDGDKSQNNALAQPLEARPHAGVMAAATHPFQAHFVPAVYSRHDVTATPAQQPCSVTTSAPPATPERMQYLNASSWEQYAAAFGSRP